MNYYAVIENDEGKWDLTRCEIVHSPEPGVRTIYTVRDTRGYLHKVLFVIRENCDGFMEATTANDCLQQEN